MKKFFIFFILSLALALNLQAQGNVHNYFSPTTGGYVQIGFFKSYILYRILSPEYRFTRLNFLGAQNGMNFYGTQSFQVAIPNGGAQVCVLSGNTQQWYNYCLPATTPNPYGSSQRATPSTSSQCPWCNGNGKIVKNDHITQYGLNSYYVYKKCPECGIEYNSTLVNHYHIQCGKCGGTGRLSR